MTPAIALAEEDPLLIAAQKVDVLDTAGRIIVNPRRNAPRASVAETFALACATERFWAIALEADLLTRAMALPVTGNDHHDAARDHAIQSQADQVRRLLAEVRSNPTENTETEHAD